MEIDLKTPKGIAKEYGGLVDDYAELLAIVGKDLTEARAEIERLQAELSKAEDHCDEMVDAAVNEALET